MSLERDGFAIQPDVLTQGEVHKLTQLIPAVPEGRAGSRDLHHLPWMREFVTSLPIVALAREALGDEACAVRVLFFDKQPGSNWKLPYHQDLTIAVAERIESPGFGPWSTKDGMVHVQPPSEVLEKMVAVRIHLDHCSSSNGALRLIPCSHTNGKIPLAELDEVVARGPEIVAEVSTGGALLMRPLTLHASSPAIDPSHRRVLHIEYSAGQLPVGLTWALGWELSVVR